MRGVQSADDLVQHAGCLVFREPLLMTLLFISGIFPGIVAPVFSKVSLSSPTHCFILLSYQRQQTISCATLLRIWKPAGPSQYESYQICHMLLLATSLFVSLCPPLVLHGHPALLLFSLLLTASGTCHVLDSPFSYPSSYLLSHIKLSPPKL